MSDFPAAGYLSNAARTEGEMKTALEAWLATTKNQIGAATYETVEIPAGGVIVPAGGASVLHVYNNGASAITGIDTTNLPYYCVVAIMYDPTVEATGATSVLSVLDDGTTAGRIRLRDVVPGKTGDSFYIRPGEGQVLLVQVAGTTAFELGRDYGLDPAARDADCDHLANMLALVLQSADTRYLDLSSHWAYGASPLGGNAHRSLDYSAYANHAYFDTTGWGVRQPSYRRPLGGLWQTYHGGARYALIPDADNLSFGDGSNDSAFSVFAWVYLDATASTQAIVRKGISGAADREWSLQYTATAKIQVAISDASANVTASRAVDSAIGAGWHFVAATYDGGGGATAADGITIYIDGVAVASTASNNGSYVAMENLAQNVGIGADNAGGSIFANQIGPRGVCATELSAPVVMALMLLTRVLAGQV